MHACIQVVPFRCLQVSERLTLLPDGIAAVAAGRWRATSAAFEDSESVAGAFEGGRELFLAEARAREAAALAAMVEEARAAHSSAAQSSGGAPLDLPAAPPNHSWFWRTPFRSQTA